MATTVVNIRREWANIYIGRPTKWGNPFRIGIDGTRAECVAKHREWIKEQPELLASLHELKDKRLGCYCKPEACHGDTLAAMADKLH
jgi:hypothetical protein